MSILRWYSGSSSMSFNIPVRFECIKGHIAYIFGCFTRLAVSSLSCGRRIFKLSGISKFAGSVEVLIHAVSSTEDYFRLFEIYG